MRWKLPIVALFVGMCLPVTAFADQISVWSFEKATVPGNWQGVEIEYKPDEAGLLLTGKAGGKLVRATDLMHRIDDVRIILTAPQNVQLSILWHVRGDPSGDLYQYPVIISGSPEPQVITLNTSYLRDWDSGTDAIGIGFLQPGNITLHRIDLIRWNMWEKLSALWLGFWKFDIQQSHTINFLWGPIIVSSPVGYEQLFTVQIPQGWSATRIFYGFLIVSIAILALLWFILERSRKMAARLSLVFIGIFAFTWLIFDIRMGAELFAYHLHDLRTHTFAVQGSKIFRNLQNFHDVIDRSFSKLTENDRYVYLGPQTPAPLMNILRYRTYPSRPLFEDEDTAGVLHWLIYRRPDITVDGEGKLVFQVNGVLTNYGRIVEQFDETSFLYEGQR